MTVNDLLKGKRIAVTGSSSGIGAETAKLLSEQGAAVLGIDLNESLENVARFYRADLSDKRSIDALVEALPPGIDGLVNNAGLPPTRPANKLLAVNLVGLKRLTAALIPKLNNGASIVNIASLAGFGWPQAVEAIRAADDLDFHEIDDFIDRWNVSNEGGRSYFFTKEALIVWTMRNRWTWRGRGIRINAVSPGPVNTPILGDFLETLGARAEEDARVMDRPGETTDVAPVIAFLLSDMAAWIRGANIPADGGMSANVLCAMHGL